MRSLVVLIATVAALAVTSTAGAASWTVWKAEAQLMRHGFRGDPVRVVLCEPRGAPSQGVEFTEWSRFRCLAITGGDARRILRLIPLDVRRFRVVQLGYF